MSKFIEINDRIINFDQIKHVIRHPQDIVFTFQGAPKETYEYFASEKECDKFWALLIEQLHHD